MKRYNRLIKRDPDERFLEYADKRIRYVLVVLELENRKPVEILRIQYSYFAFGSQGHLREDEREKKARLSMGHGKTNVLCNRVLKQLGAQILLDCLL